MNTLIWLAASSIAWGAVLCFAALLLQKHTDLSGRARQWVWRGATMLLIAPWIAAPVVGALGMGLAAPASQPIATQVVATALEVAPAATVAMIDTTTVSSVSVIREASSWLPASVAWPELVLLAIMLGWVARFVLAQMSARSLMGMVANSQPARGGSAMQALAAWAARLGLKRQPELRFGAANVSPFSYGILKPVICLPEGLERQLRREALDLVVGHECLHIARGDGWWRPLERIAADVLWFNPFAWVIRRELDMARELACDEGVVRLSAAPKAYARTLRDVAGFAAGLPAALPAASMSLAGSGRALVMRVQRALVCGPRERVRGAMVGGVVGALVCGVVGGGVAVAQAMLVTPERVHMVYAPMDMRVAEVSKAQGAVRVRLVSVVGGENAACEITLGAMHDVAVAQGDMVREGAPVGRRARNAVRVSECELDDVALARVAVMPAPVPPMPPEVRVVAPVPLLHAPVAPVVRVAPAPAPQVPPVTPLAPLPGATHSVLKGEARVVSAYGDRTDPFSGEIAIHSGVDLAQAFDARVYAPVSGTVTFSGTKGTLGRMVEIAAGGGYVLRFGHLNTIAVKTGERITAAAEVGTMGSTGRGTGPHVHIEVEHNGKTVDPMTVPGLVLAALETAPSLTPIRYQPSPAAPPAPPSPSSAASPPAAPAPLSPPAAASPPSAASPPAAAALLSPPAAASPPSLASPPAATTPPAPYAPYAPPAAISPPAPSAPPTPTAYAPVAPEAEYWKPQQRLRVEPGVAVVPNVVKVRQQAQQFGPQPQLDRVPIAFVLRDRKPVITGSRARPTSGYGFRHDPFTGREVFHAGVDIGADLGAPVHAPAAGRVTFTGEREYCGRAAEITLANDAVMRFCRLGSISVAAGDEIAPGVQIGAVGTDSQSTGPHLHFEVVYKGKLINPASIGNLVMIGG